MECSPIVYHQNNLGWVRKCTCHNAVHLNFGNVSLLLGRQQLHDFAEYLSEALIECSMEAELPDSREIYIPTRDLCIHFLLSYNELRDLLELAEQTLMMLQVEEALSI